MLINFVFTNYNNSSLSIQAIESILNIDFLENPYIVIVDNCSIEEERRILKDFERNNKYVNIHFIYSNKNLGYFAGLNLGIKFFKKKKLQFDYYIIGNNDLIFSNNFFKKMIDNHTNNIKYPVISPNLKTLDGVNQNPHVLSHISTLRKFIYKIYFSSFFMATLLSKISIVTKSFFKRKDFKNSKESCVIFMGYGACYLLTKLFFENFEELDVQTFLMGEEAFLSNQIHSKGLEIYYDSSLDVLHYDHASCGKVPVKKMWNYTKKAYLLYKDLI